MNFIVNNVLFNLLFINLIRKIYINIYILNCKLKIRFTCLSSGYDIGSGKKKYMDIYIYITWRSVNIV